MNTQKRFWLFQYAYYYPAGGMDDFRESFDTKEEALDFTIKKKNDSNDLYDTQERISYYLSGDALKKLYEWKVNE